MEIFWAKPARFQRWLVPLVGETHHGRDWMAASR
jgi:hypothetical protein